MSSNDMGDGFTIPKKIPKKNRGGDAATSSLLPSPKSGQAPRANRKVLPTRASRTADAKDTPEWEAMSKLLSHFFARADAGKMDLSCSQMIRFS